MEITQQDLQNLSKVFGYARKYIAENRQELINVLSFEEIIMKKIAAQLSIPPTPTENN